MVARIEDQIHRFLVEQEEQRCRAIEAENAKGGNTRHKSPTRKKISKPWTRPGEAALCQEIELLSMVNEYDYDLADKEFQEYCAARGVLHVAGEPGSARWKYLASPWSTTKDSYFSDSYFQFAEEVKGKRHRYTNEEMAIGWKIILLGRARLQDCWEIYSRNLRKTKGG